MSLAVEKGEEEEDDDDDECDDAAADGSAGARRHRLLQEAEGGRRRLRLEQLRQRWRIAIALCSVLVSLSLYIELIT
jgi:hypothetical protein